MQGTISRSTLIIEAFDGTNTETLTEQAFSISDLTDLESDGGAFLGVHEMVFLDDYLYMVVPVARGNRDIDKSAGVVLYRYGIHTLQLETIDTADFVHFGFAGLTVHSETGDTGHDAAVYYVQSPIEVYKYPAYNPDLPSYDTETAENHLPNFKGNLKRVLPTGEVEDCGTIRFDDEGAFRGLMTKCLVFDDALHLMIGQGSPDTLLQPESDMSRPSAALWATFGRKLNFVVPEVKSTGSLDSALTQLASQANATFAVDRGITSVINRSPIGALSESAVVEDSEYLNIKNINRSKFPSQGHLLIGNEIVHYADIFANQLANLQRSQFATQAYFHPANAQITYLDDVVSNDDLIGTEIYWSIDELHLYNTIRDSNNLIELRDALSPFNEKVLNLDFGLDNLQIPVLEFITGDYLHRFKDIRFLLNFSVNPSFHLKINDIIGFHYKAPIPPIAIQIVDIAYHLKRTVIKGRQVEPDIPVAIDALVAEPDETFRILDPQGNAMAVTGKGDHLLFIGDNAIQTITPIIFEQTLDDLTLTQFEKTEPTLMPKAIGGTKPYIYAMKGLPEGMFFDPNTRMRYGSPENAQSAKAFEYAVTDAEGVTHRDVADMTVNAADTPMQRILDPQGNAMAVTGKGNTLIFYGTYQ